LLKYLEIDTDLKIILLDYKNNYAGNMMNNAAIFKTTVLLKYLKSRCRFENNFFGPLK